MKPDIVTIGVYGFDSDGFFQALLDANVDTFCDLRLRRGMRGSKYAFVNSESLQRKLGELGIRDKIIYIPFVGFRPTLSMVPAKTLVRVSLARWWKPDRANDDRCYLQLSDWYA